MTDDWLLLFNKKLIYYDTYFTYLRSQNNEKKLKKDKKKTPPKTHKTPTHHPQAKLEMTILMGKRRGMASRFYWTV